MHFPVGSPIDKYANDSIASEASNIAARSRTPFMTMYIRLLDSLLSYWLERLPIKAILSLSLSLYLVLIDVPWAVVNSAFVAVILKEADCTPSTLFAHSQITALSSSMSKVSKSISKVPPCLAQLFTIGCILKDTTAPLAITKDSVFSSHPCCEFQENPENSALYSFPSLPMHDHISRSLSEFLRPFD